MSKTELTPEQQDALLKAFAQLTEAATKILEVYAVAVKPIMDAYHSLPQDLKEKVAEEQVKRKVRK